MITRYDLMFLIRQYVKALEETPTCERITKSKFTGGLHNTETYILDLDN